MADDLSNSQIALIAGAVVLFILALSALVISYDQGISFLDSLKVLSLFFVGPLLLLGIAFLVTVAIFKLQPLEAWAKKSQNATAVGEILTFFIFTLLVFSYGAVLGYYQMSLIVDNAAYLIPAALVAAVLAYAWIWFRREVWCAIKYGK